MKKDNIKAIKGPRLDLLQDVDRVRISALYLRGAVEELSKDEVVMGALDGLGSDVFIAVHNLLLKKAILELAHGDVMKGKSLYETWLKYTIGLPKQVVENRNLNLNVEAKDFIDKVKEVEELLDG